MRMTQRALGHIEQRIADLARPAVQPSSPQNSAPGIDSQSLEATFRECSTCEHAGRFSLVVSLSNHEQNRSSSNRPVMSKLRVEGLRTSVCTNPSDAHQSHRWL
jgi:hypothetical protein